MKLIRLLSLKGNYQIVDHSHLLNVQGLISEYGTIYWFLGVPKDIFPHERWQVFGTSLEDLRLHLYEVA